jgi:hypothetical protein
MVIRFFGRVAGRCRQVHGYAADGVRSLVPTDGIEVSTE